MIGNCLGLGSRPTKSDSEVVLDSSRPGRAHKSLNANMLNLLPAPTLAAAVHRIAAWSK